MLRYNSLILQNSVRFLRTVPSLCSTNNYHQSSNSSRKNKTNFKRNVGFIGAGLATAYGVYRLHDSPSLSDNTVAAATRQISLSEVEKHKSRSDGGIWVTYGNKVLDITQFVEQHPGGMSKIMMAAGGPLEPFFSIYAVHIDDPEIRRLLSELEIGQLDAASVKQLAEQPKGSDAFANDPLRHPALSVVSQKPFNAETPPALLTDYMQTPNELFFVRNHLPVPQIDEKNFKLEVSGPGLRRPISLSLDQLKKLPRHSTEATLMCTGNRRTDMNKYKAVRGLSWKGTAISNAKWTGVRLSDVLKHAGVDCKHPTVKHVQFEGADVDLTDGKRYGASVPADIAFGSSSEDIVLAWEMNDEPLPRDHGYPLRVIVPGVVGARHVKWLTKIVVSPEESQSFWQQNDYKTFHPSVDWSTLDYKKAEAVMEAPIISDITSPAAGETVPYDEFVTVKGYAWSGGGRGVLRVELSVDGGKTWFETKDVDRPHQPRNRVWAWSLWEAEVPVPASLARSGGKLNIMCKAVDSHQNQQPKDYTGSWNVRGLMSNAWTQLEVNIAKEE